MFRLCLAFMLLAGAAGAQDSPVIITGGSPLTIGALNDWAPSGDHQINHPLPKHTVTRVEVKYADGTSVQPTFSKQQCEVNITYGSLTVTAITNANGQALRVTTPASFATDFTHPNGRTYISVDQSSAITGLTIKRDNQVVPDIGVKPGHIEVVIHYE